MKDSSEGPEIGVVDSTRSAPVRGKTSLGVDEDIVVDGHPWLSACLYLCWTEDFDVDGRARLAYT